MLRVALPLMVSAGTFSLVLFADRTLLLWHDGESMTASMAGGNLFWVLVCLPVGVASMTGAIVSQYVGADEEDHIGRFLWQAVWLSLMSAPLFIALAWIATWLFQFTGQPAKLIPLEATYLRILMLGAVGLVLETALSGFFSGTERTRVIMWVSVASGVLNFVLDLVLIFGLGPIPALGIVGAAVGSVVSFWFKVICYGTLLLRPKYEARYRVRGGLSLDFSLAGNLLFYGFPTGLMYLTESGGFAVHRAKDWQHWRCAFAGHDDGDQLQHGRLYSFGRRFDRSFRPGWATSASKWPPAGRPQRLRGPGDRHSLFRHLVGKLPRDSRFHDVAV